MSGGGKVANRQPTLRPENEGVDYNVWDDDNCYVTQALLQ